MTTITDHRMPCGRVIFVLSRNDKVRHNMASLFVVATIFICLWILGSTFYCRRGACTRDKTTYAGIELKMPGGGGVAYSQDSKVYIYIFWSVL